jgi:phenylpyruvate tautomerase PptA (4-oxalocrotonate tautomerase family)
MPYLSLRTNTELPEDTRENLLEEASRLVSEGLGKSERYVMVDAQGGQAMRFGGSDSPLAYLELKSIGLPQEAVPALSASLCALVESHLAIPKDRIYIEFADAPRTMWGWNGRTF